MLHIQNLSYNLPGKVCLFEKISLNLNCHEKAALIGNNGVGKSTLLRIISGELSPSGGRLSLTVRPYYVPQIFGQFNRQTIAEALQVGVKLRALQEILKGKLSEENFSLLGEDWTIEDRCREALDFWHLDLSDLNRTMESVSGGEKTKAFLAGITIHQPELVLLDEPTNHLDTEGRQLLYEFIRTTKTTLLVVSHDRTLLNLPDLTMEMDRRGIHVYGGNYSFYEGQKQLEHQALDQDIRDGEKALRKAREKELETAEKQQRMNMRGKQKQVKAGTPASMMNKMKNDAQNSTARLRQVHAEKKGGIEEKIRVMRASLPDRDRMKFGFGASDLHSGKILIAAEGINVRFGEHFLWWEDLHFRIRSGERIALKGLNGSGKTTLIRVILGELEPHTGSIYRAGNKAVYIDQDYSLISDSLTVYEQAQLDNTRSLPEHEIKTRLVRFLFSGDTWDKPCRALSGGERMRLLLCCLTLRAQSPDLLILDEPVNNLDISNMEILSSAVSQYRGTLLVVSHDEHFLQEIGISRSLHLEKT